MLIILATHWLQTSIYQISYYAHIYYQDSKYTFAGIIHVYEVSLVWYARERIRRVICLCISEEMSLNLAVSLATSPSHVRPDHLCRYAPHPAPPWPP